MGKIKKHSIKWCFLVYVPICAILAGIGAYGIGIASNHVQDWYAQEYLDLDLEAHNSYEIIQDEEGNIYYSYTQIYDETEWRTDVIYWIISWAQAILIPGWVLLCVFVTGVIFYQKEMKEPITIILDASEKISANCLDFQIEIPTKLNELGELCVSFENMRSALYQNNQEMWRMLEERKRLNAAFSHDMRTPITVLKGYADLLEKYIPDGKISEVKLLEILEMMSGQITRLERYTQKMSMVHRLEDLEPKPQPVEWEDFVNQCKSISDMLAGDLQAEYYVELKKDRENREPAQRENAQGDAIPVTQMQIDEELVLEVYENLVSNAVRYAKSRVKVCVILQKDSLQITVEDDGKGFTEEALRRAADPFFREEQENEKAHFGLGLYICKLLCEKCHGELIVENVESVKHSVDFVDSETGGRVTAKFETDSR